MQLFDTNIFLEILLSQVKSAECKRLLNERIGSISITDFTLHSIGVILFRRNIEKTFSCFAEDVLPKIEIVSLSQESYTKLAIYKDDYGLDFDDAYQSAVAEERDYSIVTMDKDFKKVSNRIKVDFI